MRKKIQIGTACAFLLAIVLLLLAHARLWWTAQSCVIQHKEALGRRIPMEWFETQESPVVVPSNAQYTIHTAAPYYYNLKLRSGYQLGGAADLTIIAYFEASPNYPWWYVFDIFNLRQHEILALHEDLFVSSHQKEWLKETGIDF